MPAHTNTHPLWPDQRITRLLGIEHPVIQAPMAGVDTASIAVTVSNEGGLGSFGCALLQPGQIIEKWHWIRERTSRPVNLNFFCHEQKSRSALQQEAWKKILRPYYTELGLDADSVLPAAARTPFDEHYCEAIENIRPAVVSFHFGLPSAPLLERVKKTGAVVLSSATTVEEALWLEQHGCDVIIAQGTEAGGHRGTFLPWDLSAQMETNTLVSRMANSVSLPVIAAGGIADADGIRQALSAGAAAVQLGTAFLFCPEANLSPLYLQALRTDCKTALTNLFTGKPARALINRFINEVGPMSPSAPDFPYAADLVLPLRQASEKRNSVDFMQVWSGQRRIAHSLPAKELMAALCKAASAPL